MQPSAFTPRFSAAGVRCLAVLALASVLFALPVHAEHHNPPAEGFNLDASDAKAIDIADAAMAAMGGREAWDATRYLSWNFFGRRTHLWDKWTGALRFEQGDSLVLMNINSKEGQAFKGRAALEGEELATALDNAYKAWINDSYWLLMPYKLKDSGVTLRYVGEEAMEDGRMADVVMLTFEDVGVTPENKYHVFAAKDTGMVEQWAFFNSASDEEARFTTPWAKWEKHGNVMLSGDRGRFQLSDIAVFSEVPSSAFESKETPDRSGWR